MANINGRRVEVQLRTELQHLWAEISEKLSDIVSPTLKYGVGNPSELEFLKNLSQAIFKIEQVEAARRDFMADLHLRKVAVDKKAKKQIRQMERGFFERRTQLLQLLRNVHGEFSAGAAA